MNSLNYPSHCLTTNTPTLPPSIGVFAHQTTPQNGHPIGSVKDDQSEVVPLSMSASRVPLSAEVWLQHGSENFYCSLATELNLSPVPQTDIITVPHTSTTGYQPYLLLPRQELQRLQQYSGNSRVTIQS